MKSRMDSGNLFATDEHRLQHSQMISMSTTILCPEWCLDEDCTLSLVIGQVKCCW